MNAAESSKAHEELRTKVFGAAYRMMGSVSEAEDLGEWLPEPPLTTEDDDPVRQVEFLTVDVAAGGVRAVHSVS